MTYTSQEVVTMFSALGILVTALGAIVVNIIVAIRSSSKIDEVKEKATEISGQVKEVHTITNSNLSGVKAELSTANALIKTLTESVADLKSERQRTAIRGALDTPAPTAEQGATLENIDRNTEATAKNTAHLEPGVLPA